MKLILFTMLFLSLPVLAKSNQDFNKVLLEGVKKDIRKDEDSYKKQAVRAPASVEVEVVSQPEVPTKVDRNVRQIGPNRW